MIDRRTGSTSNATILWLGYDSPQLTDPSEPVLRTGDAQAAVPNLTNFVTSLKQVNKQMENLTLVGHSYGSLVVGEAAAASDLPVNNIVLIGSPGVSVDNVAGLHMSGSHVWVGADYDDVVSHTQQFGPNPVTVPFGANQFKVQHVAGLSEFGLAAHSHYFDADSESLKNMSEIVAGRYGSVSLDHGPDGKPLYNEPGGPAYGFGKTWPKH